MKRLTWLIMLIASAQYASAMQDDTDAALNQIKKLEHAYSWYHIEFVRGYVPHQTIADVEEQFREVNKALLALHNDLNATNPGHVKNFIAVYQKLFNVLNDIKEKPLIDNNLPKLRSSLEGFDRIINDPTFIAAAQADDSIKQQLNDVLAHYNKYRPTQQAPKDLNSLLSQLIVDLTSLNAQVPTP